MTACATLDLSKSNGFVGLTLWITSPNAVCGQAELTTQRV